MDGQPLAAERDTALSTLALFEAMDMGVVYQGSDDHILAANAAAARILGLTRDQLLGRSSFDPRWRSIREDGSDFPGDDHPSVVALRTGAPVRGVLMGIFHPAAEAYRWIVIDSFPEFAPGERRPHRTVTVFRDVTRQRAADGALRESEARYRALFDTMQEGFAINEVICDDAGEVVDYRYLDLNPAFERLTGLARATTVGRTVREVLPHLEPEWIRFFGRVALTGEPAVQESYVQELDRSYRAQAYSPRRGIFAVVFEETTAQRRAQRQLERRQRLYDDLVRAATDLVWRCDAEGRYTLLNPAWERAFGYRVEEMLGRPFADFMAPEQAALDAVTFARLLAERGRVEGYETVHRRKDGTPVYLVFNATPYLDDAGRPAGTHGTAHDVTAQRAAEEAARRQAALQRLLLDTASTYIDLPPERLAGEIERSLAELGRFAGADRAYVFRYDFQAGTCTNTHEWCAVGVAPQFGRLQAVPLAELQALAEAHRLGRPVLVPDAEALPPGGPRDLLVRQGLRSLVAVPMMDGAACTGFVGFDSARRAGAFTEDEARLLGLFARMLANVQRRAAADAALRHSEERFRALSEAVFGGIVIHEQGVILECNQGLSDLTGYSREELVGMQGFDLISPETLPTVLANVRGKYEKAYEVVGLRKDGSRYPLAIRGKNVTYQGRDVRVIEFQDVTERKRLEEERLSLERQLLHAQKLESLGVLAGGIAHDFNNLLMAILGNADMGLECVARESPAFESLQAISQAALRAADLARQMLAYSGKARFVTGPVDLNVLLEELLQMLQVSISKRARLRLDLHRPLPVVLADATQLRQVVMNLVINASEAIGDRDGLISVATRVVECDRARLQAARPDQALAEGPYVALEVTDTGCGMEAETLVRLFDPFFTTKFAGRGLGMSAVLGIVRGHQGAITVDSAPGRGSTFTVLLPVSGEAAGQPVGAGAPVGWTGSGKVLLVDDEPTVRAVGAKMLLALGFTPVTAEDGVAGLEALRQEPDGFAAVVLDLTMPRMGGEECFRAIRRLSPATRVLIASGFGEQQVDTLVAEGLSGFIPKPYTLATLREALRRAVS